MTDAQIIELVRLQKQAGLSGLRLTESGAGHWLNGSSFHLVGFSSRGNQFPLLDADDQGWHRYFAALHNAGMVDVVRRQREEIEALKEANFCLTEELELRQRS